MREVGKVVKGQLGKGFGLEALEVVFYRPESDIAESKD